MTALGEVENVLTLAQVTSPTADQTTLATLLVDHASAAIRNYTGLTITVATTTDRLEGVWGPVLTLPEWPVTAVSAVKLNGTTITGWQWDGLRGIRRNALPVDSHVQDHDVDRRQGASMCGAKGSWGGPGNVVEVTSTHGWATIPADIAAICEGMSASAFATPIGVRSEQLGSYAVTYTVESSGSSVRMTIIEARQLDSYRVRFA